MSERTSAHYDDAYFAFQRPVGEFGGWANLTKFNAYIRPTDAVLDFGCGGGYLLAKLRCRDRLGVEPNPAARAEADHIGVTVVATPAEVPDAFADVLISNNALEHCLHPLLELQALYPKVKAGGRVIFVVPCESIRLKYVAGLPGNHLYGWSPMALGNLFTEAGFTVEESRPYIHKWPHRLPYRTIARIGGRRVFEAVCRINGHLSRQWFQVRIVARKP